MSNLYQISQDLLNIFAEIEEYDGELTPELEEALAISENEYKEKIESYAKVVRNYKLDIESIDAEKKRLDSRKNVLKNRIDRLEKVMFEAVKQFGKVETPLFKIGTRKSTSTDLNLVRIDKLNRAVFNFAREIYNNGVLAFGDNCDLQGMIDAINANMKAEHEASTVLGYEGGEYIPYTVEDLSACKININSSSTIADLFTHKDGALKALLENECNFDVQQDNNKTDIKNLLKNNVNITIGKLVDEEKLSIR